MAKGLYTGRVRGQIGIRTEPWGGFGNRVLAYMGLRLIAHRLDAHYFSVNHSDRKRISGIDKRSRLPFSVRPPVTFAEKDIVRSGFLDLAREELANKQTILLKPPLLGEVFARYDEIEIGSVVRHRFSRCAQHRRREGALPEVVMHLRGTDFASWNPKAILGVGYYLDALDSLNLDLSKFQFRICTDDIDHPALSGLTDHLKNQQLSPAQCDSPFECDFAAMASANVLVASPSTFSIVAGLLGEPRVVMSKVWVEDRVERGELFWEKVQKHSLNGLDVVSIV